MRLTAVPALALTAALAGLAVPAVQARAADVFACVDIGADDLVVSDAADSVPLTLMGVDEAHEILESRGLVPGQGVAVAVVDSGVSTENQLITVRATRSFVGSSATVEDPHGTEVAGLIAGHARPDGKLVGVAPGAEIVDVRVYGPDPSTGQAEVSPERVVDGLNWVADNAGALGIKVVNVSLALARDPELKRAVGRLRQAKVIVVAASGNRPTEDADPLFAGFGADGAETGPGEDAAEAVYPAGYPDVLAVSATTDGLAGAGDPTQYVLPNTATDVAAPTYDAVSVGTNGSTCRVRQVATSYAAAEVSGVIALLCSAFPDDTPAQILTRLERTASGTTDNPTRLQGAGVVQPVEALTRPLHPDRGGAVDHTTTDQGGTPRAAAPEPDADVLADTRDRAVWWGLLGGGALLLALILRPVLARHRD